jgi:hypothetical protein
LVVDADNPYGQARSGRLAVAAPLMEVMIAIFTLAHSGRRLGREEHTVSVNLDPPTTPSSGDVTPGVDVIY